jgi:hypothetical protein
MYSWQPERGAWQSAVHMRAVCQGVIPVVAIRGILLRSLAYGRIPVPAILHRQFPCLLPLTHKSLMRGFLGVRQIRYAADCLGLNYTPIVSVDTPSLDTPSRDTIHLRTGSKLMQEPTSQPR